MAVLVCVTVIVGCSKNDEPQAENESFDVVITGVVDNETITAIKGVREVTGLGLKDAKDLVERAPAVVKESLTKTEADAVAQTLRQASLTVEVRKR